MNIKTTLSKQDRFSNSPYTNTYTLKETFYNAVEQCEFLRINFKKKPLKSLTAHESLGYAEDNSDECDKM